MGFQLNRRAQKFLVPVSQDRLSKLKTDWPLHGPIIECNEVINEEAFYQLWHIRETGGIKPIFLWSLQILSLVLDFNYNNKIIIIIT